MKPAPDTGCPSGLAPAENETSAPDPAAFVRKREGGKELELYVRGAKCAGCISKIEKAVTALDGVEEARLNLSTGKLHVRWQGGLAPARVTSAVAELGYGVTPFDPVAAEEEKDAYGRLLIRSLAVAGFAAANIMLLSVSVWAANGGEMGEATRRLFHLISGLIAIPAALYAGRPFFSSAWGALKQGHANMDVPISLAVFLALGVSLSEALMGGVHAYFDAAVMLLFFLLIGRWLDHHLRNKARSAARDLLALQATTATRLDAGGHAVSVTSKDIAPGDRLRLGAGDRVPVDVTVLEGESDVDVALLTGEPIPITAKPGDRLSGGAVNLSHTLIVRAEADVTSSLVADLVRLVEAGQQTKGRFTILADRAARAYVPIVHTLAAVTFAGWLFFGAGVREAIMAATAVLIITCPCALGLATPAVQVVATGQLFRRGILVKSGDALERLAAVRHVVFDKTGTLTRGQLSWLNPDALDTDQLSSVAQLARASRHPIARAIVVHAGGGPVADTVDEYAGLGVRGTVEGREILLGRAEFVGAEDPGQAAGPMAWVRIGETAPIQLRFADTLRKDSIRTIENLKEAGPTVSLLSGDRAASVEAIARETGIDDWTAEVTPQDKAEVLKSYETRGIMTAMVGDGINDAPAMAHAGVSLSPGTAADAAQSAADFVFQGEELSAIIEARGMALRSKRHILQNFAFAAAYNLVAAPLAMAGIVTPLIAALAMSGSSLIVTLNALRLAGGKKAT
ncbi:heavy metal translocating P-type ATPase [Parvularcula marina]|uniref:Cadmium-translocating P-type ATPase n=1 Tax=Parvularcula marina TaxID=2292771 RepID=A0A371R7K7_9PROT|nr:heavy metal translocating P-type ATPase [Parvularcula marina]RFB01441.1 cadmium-translocating P-type ATPase [Parvularcula marina]